MEKNLMENANTKSTEAQAKLTRLQQFLGYDPDNDALWIDAVRLAIDLQDWKTAKHIVTNTSAALLEKAEINALAGQVLLTHKEYDKAAPLLEKAIGLKIPQASTWINLAFCYFYLDQFDQAAELLDANSWLKQDLPQEYLLLAARVSNHRDDADTAIKLLKELHEQHEVTAESAGLLSLLLFEEDSDPALALEMANLALAKNPHAIEALISRSSLHLDSRQYELAEADIRLALEHYPQVGRAWATLAQIEFNNLHFDAASDAAEAAVKTMPDHIGTWHLLGWAHIMRGQYEPALEAFKQSYELDRRFAETHGGLACAYAHLGETKLANNHIKLAEKLDPENFSINYAKMVLMNQNNQSEQATNLFTQWVSTTNSRLKATPQTLINKRMQELMRNQSSNKTLH